MSDKITINPSPKVRFMATKALVEAHNNAMQQPTMQAALDMAMLQYQGIVADSSAKDMNGAVAGYFRLLGAKEFLNVLIQLGHSTTLPQSKPVDNLDHRA